MENIDFSEITLKTSRIYFLGNYFIAGLVIIFLILAWPAFEWKFTIAPKTQPEFINTLIILGLMGIATALIEQPEWERFRIKFIITMNEVIKQEGIFNKHRLILPYGTVADISVMKNILGRTLNYGTLSVSSFRSGSDIIMKGIKNPEKFHTMIQNRVNILREGQLGFFKKPGETPEVQVKETKEDMINKKKELEEMIEQTKQSFYNREIDEKQFESTIEKFQQQIIEINVKLKKIGKK